MGKRPRRGQAAENDTPFSEQDDARSREAGRAYRCTLWGLVPGLGLLLGPLGAVLGLLVLCRGAATVPGHNRALAAAVLGGLLGLTNWLGLGLMILGLRH